MALLAIAACQIGLASKASAQLTVVVPAVGTTWKYIETDVSSQNWTNLNYDDSAWLSGPSGFAYETGGSDVSHLGTPETTLIRTTLTNPANDPADALRHAEYFRTKFNWSGATAGAQMVIHSRWDDSGVIYLNGHAIFNNTDNPLPLGFIQYTRGAIGAGTEAIVDETVTVDVTGILNSGENVLAAEMHQVNNGSSDRVFVCEASIGLPVAPQITNLNQPTNRFVLQNRSTTLIVEASGFPTPAYQWFFSPDGGGGFAPILDATNASYTIASMQPENGGEYYVSLVNVAGSVDSRTAVVTFTTDEQGPSVVRVSQAGAFNLVNVTFDEVVDETTATDPFTYHLSDGVNEQDPTAVTLNADGRSVTVEYDLPMQEGTLHTITVAGVQDVAQNPMPAEVNVQFTSWVASDCGGVLFEAFDTSDVAGTLITQLTGHPTFPNRPRESYRLRAFSTRSRLVSDDSTPYGDDSHEQYGGRLRALFIPPTDGNWVFYLSSDDAGQLFLNPTGPGEGGKIKIQEETGCCNVYSTHASAPFALQAGKAYYLEALYKEGGGGDYCHVWAGPQGVVPPATAAASLTEAEAIPGSMLGFPAAPLNAAGTFTITQQPADQSAVPNAVATFTVGTSTDALKCYQWLRNGVEIPNANGSSYSITVAQGDNGAKFSVRISIVGGNTATSSEATLTVGQDQTAPTVVSVVANTAGTSLTVTFSEPMGASAANAANYTVNGTAASSVTLNGSSTVATVVLSAPLSAGGCTLSQVSIAGVTDQATQPNVVAPNPTVVSLSSPYIEILALGATWKYNDSGADLGTAWQATAFNDSAWLSGPAPLGFEPGTPQVPVVATAIAELTKTNIAYFRTHFNLAVAPSSVVVLQLGEIVDDGAVYYLNGVELHRSYMPAAPAVIDATTLATGGGPEPTDGTHTVVTVNVPATALVAGDNVLAVELHPSSLTSSDSEFAAQLNIVQCVPSLAIQHVGSEVKLTWTDAAYRLETAPAPDGPWTIRAGKSGLQLPAAVGNGFFRLVTP